MPSSRSTPADLSALLATINEQSTGLSPTFFHRLRTAIELLAASERSTATLMQDMGLTGPQLNPALRTGKRLNVIRERPGKRGQPWILSADRDALAAFAKSNRPDHLPALQMLGEKRRELLQRFDWKAAGIPTIDAWRRAIRVLVAIGDVRKISYASLADELSTSELSWTFPTIKISVNHLCRAGILSKKSPRNKRETNAGTLFTVLWDKISAKAKLRIQTSLDLPVFSVPIRNRTVKPTRLSASQRALLAKVDSRLLNCTAHEASAVRVVLQAVGAVRSCSIQSLAKEMRVSPSTVDRGKALASRLGLLTTKAGWDELMGRKTTIWEVHWDKVAKLVGDAPARALNVTALKGATRGQQPFDASGNGHATTNGHAKTNGHATPPLPRAGAIDKQIGGRKAEWEPVVIFAVAFKNANPRSTWRQALDAYAAAHPEADIPGSHGDLKSAVSYWQRRRKPR